MIENMVVMGTTKVFLCVAVLLLLTNVSALHVSLTNSGKAVRGSNVTFTAKVSDYAGENLKFLFHDNATPQHNGVFMASANVYTWTVQYPKNLYEPGDYTVYVRLMKNWFGIWIYESSSSTTFQLTDTLNGNLTLNQNNEDLSTSFVTVNKTVRHYIKLPENELQFLKEKASSVVTYWFIDCMLYGSTEDLSLNYTYDDNMSDHHVEAILIANNEPLPPLTTTTTTTTTTTPKTTTTTTTTTTPKTTTITTTTTTTLKTTTTATTTTTETTTTTSKAPSTDKPVTTETLPKTTDKSPITTDKPSSTTATVLTTSATVMPTIVPEKVTNGTTPVMKLESENKSRSKRSTSNGFTCNNSVPFGRSYTHGRYELKVSVRESISIINITGLNWLKQGQLLNLEVKYAGSPPFDYCVFYKMGEYNVTGNETCESPKSTTSNEFPLVHYFANSDQHTVVVVIQNEIGKNVSRATVNFYKSVVHAQLSVIVVPVFFCLVAVILVVFGIAYYQHRSRHTVEVADFDFGQAHPDFKTFGERLRDSFRNAFNFRNQDDTDPLTSNSRYDSMS